MNQSINAASDIQLHTGQIVNDNNLIVAATNDMQLGPNAHVNNPIPSSDEITHVPGPLPSRHVPQLPLPHVSQPSTSVEERVTADQHDGERTALVVGLVAVGIIILWLFL